MSPCEALGGSIWLAMLVAFLLGFALATFLFWRLREREIPAAYELGKRHNQNLEGVRRLSDEDE